MESLSLSRGCRGKLSSLDDNQVDLTENYKVASRITKLIDYKELADGQFGVWIISFYMIFTVLVERVYSRYFARSKPTFFCR